MSSTSAFGAVPYFRTEAAVEQVEPIEYWTTIVKLVGPCNLGCDYCYEYNGPDKTWLDQEQFMSLDTFGLLVDRLAEDEYANPMRRFNIVLHGGEPLMWRKQNFRNAMAYLRQRLPEAPLGMQTNGVLLDEEWLDICKKFDISMGISLDGPQVVHDAHRTLKNGLGSYERVVRGINLVRQEGYKHLFSGLLAVIDVTADPIAVYEELASHQPPAIDMLLPYGNWDNPPPMRSTAENTSTPYADWLNTVFYRWYRDPSPSKPNVRLFQSTMRLLLGEESMFESIGLLPVREFVVRPGGSIEKVDSLKSTEHGATLTDMSLQTHSVGAIIQHPHLQARQASKEMLKASLADPCQRCPLVDVCGGGFIANRYGRGRGFDNPSVYCADLISLIAHIGSVLREEIVISNARKATGEVYGQMAGGAAY